MAVHPTRKRVRPTGIRRARTAQATGISRRSATGNARSLVGQRRGQLNRAASRTRRRR